MSSFSSNAQGTIEYIVIIAVVVVISLVVVGLLVNQTGESAQVSSITQQIANSAQLIGVSEAVVGQDSNALFSLRNNTGESITVTKIDVDGVDHNFSKQLVGIDLSAFVLNNVIACTSSSQLHDVAVTYTTVTGLEKTQSFSKVKIDCVPIVNPKQPFVVESITNLYVASAHYAYFILDTNFLNGIFNYTKLGTIKPTGELDRNTSANYTYQSSDYNRDMNGLIAYYKFNSKNGSVITDYAGYDDNGTLTNGADNNVQGLWDTNAGFFDGTNDYVELSSNLQTSVSKYTISTWVKIPSLTAGGVIYQTRGTGAGKSLTFSIGSGMPSFILDTDNVLCGRSSSTVIPINKWVHLVGVFDSTSGQQVSPSNFFLYLNGQRVDSANTLQGTCSTSPLSGLGTAKIAYHQAWNGYFKGSIEEFKIYNRALSATEIQADYNKWFTDSNYISPVIDTSFTSTDFNSIKFNTNNGVDLNGHIYGTQIEPTIEKDLNTGLVGLWHLNETSGTSFVDSSGKGNNGSCTSCPTPASGLWDTNAQSFDGSPSHEYISIGNRSGFPTGNGAFTFSAWVKPTDISNSSNYQTIFMAGNMSCPNGVMFFIPLGTSKISLQWHCGYGRTDSVATLTNGRWYHVAATYSGSVVKVYLNGNLENFTNYSGSNLINNSAYISDSAELISIREFYGAIEEVGVWNRVLDANEVKELFNKGAAKLGVKYNACTDSSMSTGCTGWLPAATDGNTLAGTQINLDALDGKRYLQYLIKPQLYLFPDGNYYPQAFAILRDVNLVYTN